MVDPTLLSTFTTARFYKVIPIPLVTLQTVTPSPRVVISSIVDVTNISASTIYIHMGRINSTAFTPGGINFRIESSSQISGDNNWIPITIFTSALGGTITTTTVSTQSNAGQNVITLTSSTVFAIGDIIYIQNATESNSEFARVIATSNSTPGTLTLENNLTFTQQVGAKVTNKAEMYSALIDTSSFTRLRIVVDGSNIGNTDFDASVDMTTGA